MRLKAYLYENTRSWNLKGKDSIVEMGNTFLIRVSTEKHVLLRSEHVTCQCRNSKAIRDRVSSHFRLEKAYLSVTG